MSDTRTDSIIELVQLENGDIALRNSEAPDQPLLTINFSEQVRGFLQADQMSVANAMVEAGINRYRDVQIERIKEGREAAQTGMLH
ncbi:MAG: hypothetical protein ACJATO_002549 [Arenicella sp.]|jgi:hypothetical protein